MVISSIGPTFREDHMASLLYLPTYLCMLDSIISAAMALSRWFRWLANSGSGQWRSRTKFCKASSFQKISSEVAHPLLKYEVNVMLQNEYKCQLGEKQKSSHFIKASQTTILYQDVTFVMVSLQTKETLFLCFNFSCILILYYAASFKI